MNTAKPTPDLGKIIDIGEQIKEGKPVGPGTRVPTKIYPVPEIKKEEKEDKSRVPEGTEKKG